MKSQLLKLFFFLWALPLLGDSTNAYTGATREWVTNQVPWVKFALTNIISSTNALTISISNRVAWIGWSNSPAYATASITNGLANSSITNGLAPYSVTNNLVNRTTFFTNAFLSYLDAPGLNSMHTNGANKAMVFTQASLLPTPTAYAFVEFYHVSGNVTNIWSTAYVAGASTNINYIVPMSGWLQPNSIYWFTNESQTGAGASLGNYNVVEQ